MPASSSCADATVAPAASRPSISRGWVSLGNWRACAGIGIQMSTRVAASRSTKPRP